MASQSIEYEIVLPPEKAFSDEEILKSVRSLNTERVFDFSNLQVTKRSIDARRKPIVYRLKVVLYNGFPPHQLNLIPHFKEVKTAEPVHIIGSGPAGLFAALSCLEQGLKPIIYERGKDVRTRRRDLARITREGIVNPDSNYGFGEGGAGTYSDGKLYTRSKKRGSVEKIMQLLVHFGADPDILVNAHPHIGTNKLPAVITAIRNHIIDLGGEVHFDSKVDDLRITCGVLHAIHINGQGWKEAHHLILASGHSARDIYMLLAQKQVEMEYKPFAMGVRIEHPQILIDQVQYKCESRGEFLPPSSYSLVTQAEGRGVYSFCMCPGGIIAPCATAPDEVVTNGWSPSKRDNAFANSGIVTEVRWEDIPGYHKFGALAGMYFQMDVERKCAQMAGGNQKAPAQRLVDFLQNKTSGVLPPSSYHPGITSVPLNLVLPEFIVKAIRTGLSDFCKKMPAYKSEFAVLHAPESRTSSPVRICRNPLTFESTNTQGIFPVGEGAGFAGGIVSAAVDGMNAVEAIASNTRA